MKIRTKHTGLTIMEILIAVMIVAILAAGLYSVGGYVAQKTKIDHTKSTIEILSAALEQYYDFYGKFPFEASKCYDKSSLESSVLNGLNGKLTHKDGSVLSSPDYYDVYASIEALYYFLNKCPDSRKMLDAINPSLITNKDIKKTEYFFEFTSEPNTFYPLRHIVDAWNMPLRYTYISGDNFPVITSAGPNGKFGDRGTGDNDANDSTDNITSR